MKILQRSFVIFLLGIVSDTCIDPYLPHLDHNEQLLVVDGLLTNEEHSCTVILSRTKAEKDLPPVMVSGAVVTIGEIKGPVTELQETGNGVYSADSIAFRGEVGKTYLLRINTTDGKTYESDPCMMYPSGRIDSIHFEKDIEILNSRNEVQDGLRFFIDCEVSSDCRYYRWDYEEWWKFKVPNVARYEFINENDIRPIYNVKEICWKHDTGDPIVTQFVEEAQSDKIENKPFMFIPSGISDRFLIRYCIEIRQLSISQNEYEFWSQMRKVGDSGGNIFDIQPFPVVSNIHNVNNIDEPVLGYFKVSAAERKRFYISRSDLAGLGLKVYLYDCEEIPLDISSHHFSSFDNLYNFWAANYPSYAFIKPVYERGSLVKLVFAKKECTDCSLTGSLSEPDFWTD